MIDYTIRISDGRGFDDVLCIIAADTGGDAIREAIARQYGTIKAFEKQYGESLLSVERGAND